MENLDKKFRQKQNRRYKKRYFIMLFLAFLLTITYFNGRGFHIEENIGYKDIEVF